MMTWRLHHDHASTQTTFSVMVYLAEHRIPTLSKPPYHPDIAPIGFSLFPRLKRVMKWRHHVSVQAI